MIIVKAGSARYIRRTCFFYREVRLFVQMEKNVLFDLQRHNIIKNLYRCFII